MDTDAEAELVKALRFYRLPKEITEADMCECEQKLREAEVRDRVTVRAKVRAKAPRGRE